MALFEPSLPSTPIPLYWSSGEPPVYAAELTSITYVTAVVDLTTSEGHNPIIESIYLPLLEAKKGERIEVVNRCSPSIWIGLIAGRQGAFTLDHTVVRFFVSTKTIAIN